MLHEHAELTGTVHQGVIVVDEGIELPEGQTVKIILKQPPANGTPQAETAGQQVTELAEASPSGGARKAASPLGELLLKYAGVIDDLPSDMAKNHDHYLHYFSSLLDDLKQNPQVTIIPPDEALFDEGAKLYRDRPDKDWSLTDCISFLVMEREGITDALTGDHHFEQAGFNILFK